jgi:hypothetical protein
MKNIDYKLDLEERLTCLETKVNEIMTNHLPHIEAKVDRIQWLLIVTLIGVVANLIQKLA